MHTYFMVLIKKNYEFYVISVIQSLTHGFHIQDSCGIMCHLSSNVQIMIYVFWGRLRSHLFTSLNSVCLREGTWSSIHGNGRMINHTHRKNVIFMFEEPGTWIECTITKNNYSTSKPSQSVICSENQNYFAICVSVITE